ncbi:hypothetical protein DFS34DRAFT_626908 [Phlyctochytrium arcticum]|nr:hypothetical protein DFS34DRAFT_626908 [Phlyctochytrium arcticum]
MTQVEKWRSDKSIPLVEVVDSFDIFEVPTGGNTGMFERPSKQILETSFGTSNQDEIIHKILSEGKITNASDKLNKANGPGNSSRGAYQGRVD